MKIKSNFNSNYSNRDSLTTPLSFCLNKIYWETIWEKGGGRAGERVVWEGGGGDGKLIIVS